VRRRESLKQQRLFEYGRAVLESLREVEDALVLEASQIRRLDSLEEQVRLAGASLEQLRREYINGISDYLDVLTALTDEQRLRRDLLSSRLALFEFRIALYRALAGPLTSGPANP
jgi:outer membrane protein TolC